MDNPETKTVQGEHRVETEAGGRGVTTDDTSDSLNSLVIVDDVASSVTISSDVKQIDKHIA